MTRSKGFAKSSSPPKGRTGAPAAALANEVASATAFASDYMTGYEPGVDEWYAAREESLIMSADLSMILESPTVERVATDFVFTEGPLWHPDGFLLFVDIRRSLLLRWQPGEGVAIVRETTGEGNGVT